MLRIDWSGEGVGPMTLPISFSDAYAEHIRYERSSDTRCCLAACPAQFLLACRVFALNFVSGPIQQRGGHCAARGY